MAINHNGKEYQPEEILTLPEDERRKIIGKIQAENNGHIYYDEDEAELSFTEDKPEEDIPVTTLHEIRNPQAAKEYERLVSSGFNEAEALDRLRGQFRDFDKEPDEDEDKEYSKLKKEAAALGIPYPQIAKVIGYSLAHGISIKEAAIEVQIRLTRYTALKGTKPAVKKDEDRQKDSFEKAYDAQQKLMGLGKYNPKSNLEERKAAKVLGLGGYEPAQRPDPRQDAWDSFHKTTLQGNKKNKNNNADSGYRG